MRLTVPGNMTRINLGPTSLRASASYRGHNHISPPTCGVFLQKILTSGWNTATLRPAAHPSLSYARLVSCIHESAGKVKGVGGRKIGNAHLKWAFSEAACLMLRAMPAAKLWLARQERKRGKKKALSAKIDRTVYHFTKLAEKGSVGALYGWGLHNYTWNLSKGQSDDWFQAKGDGLNFGTEEWYELFRQGDTMEPLINSHWQAMGEIDRQHRVKLIVDEWGAWYKPGTEAHPTHLLGQASTLRDALSVLLADTHDRATVFDRDGQTLGGLGDRLRLGRF